MSKHDLTEYAFARDIVRDFPSVIKELEKTVVLLRKHNGYAACAHSLQSIYESLEAMERQLIFAKDVIKNRGRINR